MSTFGRRTWNKEDYIGVTTSKDLPNFTETELQQLKIKYTNYNKLMQDANTNINKKTIVTNVMSYKKGKQFGFYCDLCDLTFKDTLQYIDHLNHKIHQVKFEQLFGEPLILDIRENDDIPIEEFKNNYRKSISQFVKLHKDKVKSLPKKSKPKNKTRTAEPSIENDISQMMGFGSFGTSKK